MIIRFNYFHLLVFLCLGVSCLGQSNLRLGLSSNLNFNKKITENEKLNLKIESRQNTFDEGRFNLEYSQTQISLFGSTGVSYRSSLAIGYSFTIRGGADSHMTAQQLAITNTYGTFRVGHRFSSDQSFGGDRTTRVRARYRISCQLPLKGQIVNVKEFYIKLNNEYLNSFTSSAHDLEVRVAGNLGFEFHDNNKVELGVDYSCLLYTSPSPRDGLLSRMPSSA